VISGWTFVALVLVDVVFALPMPRSQSDHVAFWKAKAISRGELAKMHYGRPDPSSITCSLGRLTQAPQRGLSALHQLLVAHHHDLLAQHRPRTRAPCSKPPFVAPRPREAQHVGVGSVFGGAMQEAIGVAGA
jgi:hypothetical protein